MHGKKKDENPASKDFENGVFITTNTVHVFTCLPTFQASTLSLKPQQDHSVDLANEIENLVKLKMVRLSIVAMATVCMTINGCCRCILNYFLSLFSFFPSRKVPCTE